MKQNNLLDKLEQIRKCHGTVVPLESPASEPRNQRLALTENRWFVDAQEDSLKLTGELEKMIEPNKINNQVRYLATELTLLKGDK